MVRIMFYFKVFARCSICQMHTWNNSLVGENYFAAIESVSKNTKTTFKSTSFFVQFSIIYIIQIKVRCKLIRRVRYAKNRNNVLKLLLWPF